jgi:hypothetical protein
MCIRHEHCHDIFAGEGVEGARKLAYDITFKPFKTKFTESQRVFWREE